MQTREREREKFHTPSLHTNSSAKLVSVNPTNSNLNPTNSTHTILLAQNEVQAPNVEFQNSNAEFQATSNQNQASSGKIQSYELEETTIQADLNAHTSKYQSGSVVDKNAIESMPTGGGDIITILRSTPNVRFNQASRTSNMPGELNPASISISGGLPYQNSFVFEGLEMNNDLDSAAGALSVTQHTVRSGFSQGLNVDVSLLESVTVLDSNIGASYGRFSGGVIESVVRRPRKDEGILGTFHGNVSWQHTRSQWTKYFWLDNVESEVANSSNENYQPNFNKNIFRAALEGWVNEKLGFVASFSSARTSIPLQAYNNGTSEEKKKQKRQSDNYFLKVFYSPLENFDIEAYLSYMPMANTYFGVNAPESYYDMESGGLQTGLKTLLNTKLGLFTNTFGYSYLENSRNSEANYHKFTATGYAGQWGSLDQNQYTTSYKGDFAFVPLESGILTQNFKLGLDLSNQKAQSHRPSDTHKYFTCGANTPTGNVDIFGIDSGTCNQQMFLFKKHKVDFTANSWAFWAEDDAEFDLRGFGEIDARLGLRLDGDDYLKKHTLAPRFSLNYLTPTDKSLQSKLTFGANRYYARNLIGYKYRAIMNDNREIYRRVDANSPWTLNSISPMTTGAYRDTDFSKLKVPYDDELMVAFSQNLGPLNATVKYIHRDGKKQITQELNESNAEVWGNGGKTKADLISFELKNIEPINTFGVGHLYQLNVDYSDTRRTYNTFSSYYNLTELVAYNGEVMSYANMPSQIYKQPFMIRLTTTHALKLGAVGVNFNNFFRLRSKYDRVVFEKSSTATNANPCSATNPSVCEQYSKMSFKSAFNWDMRLGFEVDIYKGNALYVNFDIYNVLNSKNLTTIGLEDGALLNDGRTSAGVLTYELGRQFWTQIGYKW